MEKRHQRTTVTGMPTQLIPSMSRDREPDAVSAKILMEAKKRRKARRNRSRRMFGHRRDQRRGIEQEKGQAMPYPIESSFLQPPLIILRINFKTCTRTPSLIRMINAFDRSIYLSTCDKPNCDCFQSLHQQSFLVSLRRQINFLSFDIIFNKFHILLLRIYSFIEAKDVGTRNDRAFR